MSFVPPLFHPFVFSCTSVIKFTVVKNDCVLLGRRTIVYYWEEERLCTTGEKNDCVLLGGKSDCVLLYWGGENDCVLQSLGEKQLCTTVGKTSCVLLGGGGGGREGRTIVYYYRVPGKMVVYTNVELFVSTFGRLCIE